MQYRERLWIVGVALASVVAFSLFALQLDEWPGAGGSSGSAASADRWTCVSPNYDHIGLDLHLSGLVFRQNPREPTDDAELYQRFLKEILPRLRNGADKRSDIRRYYVVFNAYFHPNAEWMAMMATSVVCEKPFGETDNICRNRNYYFFRTLPPEEVARQVLDDIWRTEPRLDRCVARKASEVASLGRVLMESPGAYSPGATAAAPARLPLLSRVPTRTESIGGTTSSVSKAESARPPTTTEPRPR